MKKKFVFLAVLSVVFTACKLLNPKTEADVAKASVCILDHNSDPPAQILVECAQYGVQSAEDVISVLAAEQHAVQRAQHCHLDAGVDAQ